MVYLQLTLLETLAARYPNVMHQIKMIKNTKMTGTKNKPNEFLKELGEFVLSFERVCESMRYAIIFMLRSQGLSNEDMAFVIVGDKNLC